MLECTHLILGLFVGECPEPRENEYYPYTRIEAVVEFAPTSWQVLISNSGGYVLEECVIELTSERGRFSYRYVMELAPGALNALDRFDFRNRLDDAPRHLDALRIECLDTQRLDVIVERLEVDNVNDPGRRWQRLVPSFE